MAAGDPICIWYRIGPVFLDLRSTTGACQASVRFQEESVLSRSCVKNFADFARQDLRRERLGEESRSALIE